MRSKIGMVEKHTSEVSTQKTNAGGLRVQDQSGLHRKTLS